MTLLCTAFSFNEVCVPFSSKRRSLSMWKMKANHKLPCLTWQHALAIRILILLKVLSLKVSLKCSLCVCPINLEMMKWFSLELWSAIRKKDLMNRNNLYSFKWAIMQVSEKSWFSWAPWNPNPTTAGQKTRDLKQSRNREAYWAGGRNKQH